MRIDQTIQREVLRLGQVLARRHSHHRAGRDLQLQPGLPRQLHHQHQFAGTQLSVHAVNLIRPNLVNDAGFNFNYSAIVSTPVGLTAKVNNPDINPTEPFPNPRWRGAQPHVYQRHRTISGLGPYNDYNRNYACVDSLTWIKGRHTFRFGYSFNRYNKTENADGAQGSFGFTNRARPPGPAPSSSRGPISCWATCPAFSMPSQDVTPGHLGLAARSLRPGRFQSQPASDPVHGRALESYFGQPTDSQRRDGQLRSGALHRVRRARDQSGQRQLRDSDLASQPADRRDHRRRQELALRRQGRATTSTTTSRPVSA